MAENLQQIATYLKQKDRILIITHHNPDGDTLGSGFGLYYALCKLGKHATVICSDPFPQKFNYLLEAFQPEEFEPDCTITVDIASPQLLGKNLEHYQNKIDVCVDHHGSNNMMANMSYIDCTAAATCEIIYHLILELGVAIDKNIADCLYTGISTDTGCFRFSNTTAQTHCIAADLFGCGCSHESINRRLFETKSKSRIIIEKKVLETMEFYIENQVAMIVITQQMIRDSQIDTADLDGVAAIARQIEGVEVGITMRERLEGGYKVSLRTSQFVNAAEVCMQLGGGGHMRAAGCVIDKPLEEAKKILLDVIIPCFEK